MEPNKIGGKQFWMWFLAAVFAPLAHFSGVGCLAMGVTAAALLPLTAVAMDGWEGLGKKLAFLEMVGTVLVLAALIPASGVYWPASRNETAVPIVILILAALSGRAERCARAGSVIGMVSILLLTPLVLSAAGQIRFARLADSTAQISLPLIPVMLLPSLAGLWTVSERKRIGYLCAVGGAALLFAVITQGILGLTVASSVPDAFYQAARCLGRFEPVTASAVTLGWYALATFLVRTVCRFGARCGIPEKWGILLAVGVPTVFILFRVHQNDAFLTVLTLFLWVFAPFLNAIKKLKKIEKSS